MLAQLKSKSQFDLGTVIQGYFTLTSGILLDLLLLQLPDFPYLLNPGFPLPGEFFNFFRMLTRQILRFSAVFIQIIKFPWPFAGFHQLPVSVPKGLMVSM